MLLRHSIKLCNEGEGKREREREKVGGGNEQHREHETLLEYPTETSPS
jgi:hypothetical protein